MAPHSCRLQTSVRNCCQKGGLRETYHCWAWTARWQVAAPPTAAPCCGTRVSLEIPVLHGGEKRQESGEVAVFAHVEIVGFFSLFPTHSERKWTHGIVILHFQSCVNELRWLWVCRKTPLLTTRIFIFAFVHPCAGPTTPCAVCGGGRYQLIPLIMGALQTNSWKPIKATYYVITSPLSPETPL